MRVGVAWIATLGVTLALGTNARAVDVDIYQSMSGGSDGILLSPEVMNPSSHGGTDGLDGDWNTFWDPMDPSDGLWVSDQFARTLPGAVTVGGVAYPSSSPHTWRFRDRYESNFLRLTFGTLPRTDPWPPYHDRVVVACYYTPGQTQPVWNTHDNIVLSANTSFAVMQTLRDSASAPLQVRAHSSIIVGDKWKSTFSPPIDVVAGKTYWVNLYHDGPGGWVHLAVFDPDDSWSQVGTTVAAESMPGAKIKSSTKFGRCSPHADNSWTEETYSHFSHVLIDYTDPPFPLLPDFPYWVSPNGQASWEDAQSATPLSGAAASSLTTANAHAQAGDTVYLRGGTYSSGAYVHPQHSGTENARITFASHADEIATFEGVSSGIVLDGQSYVTVRGLEFHSVGHFFFVQNGAHHNEIADCLFDQAMDPEMWEGAKIYYSSQYNWVHGCTFSRWGWYNPSSELHRGAMLDVGMEGDPDDESRFNLVEDNTFYSGGHHLLAAWGQYNVFRNNYLHNEGWELDPGGYRCAISHGAAAGRNLFEGNRFAFAGLASGFTLRSWKNIFRSNAFYANGAGGIQFAVQENSTPAHHNRLYNNVFFDNGHQEPYAPYTGGVYFVDWWGLGDPTDNVLKNNIFHANAGGVATFYQVSDPQVFENNWDEEGDPLFVYDGGPIDPFGEQPDFHLRPGSPCIDSGGPLTIITSAAGSGTQFVVQDASYFMDGWGIVTPDEIQLSATTQRARIVNIDYDSNLIEVDRPLMWTQNQGVSLRYEGAAPDIGAFEVTDQSLLTIENTAAEEGDSGVREATFTVTLAE